MSAAFQKRSHSATRTPTSSKWPRPDPQGEPPPALGLQPRHGDGEVLRPLVLGATHSRLKPMAEVNKPIQRHLPNVLTYLHHGLTNGGLEAVNATIQVEPIQKLLPAFPL